MTPLEKAEDAGQRLGLFGPDAGGHERSFHSGDAAAIIRAFLEAAAEDERTAERAGMAALLNGPHLNDAGQAAILALKEAVNG